jgi:glutathione S-transferase
MAAAAAPAPALKLYYFNINGLAARIRLAALVGGVALEDYRFADRAEFAALKAAGTLPFGQVPLLEINDGGGAAGVTRVAQSGAILRYVCRLGGLYPTENALACAAVDAALDAEKDAFAAYTAIKYRDRSGLSAMDDAALATAEAALNEEVLPRHLRQLEALLGASESGWVAGTARPSPADFAWGSQLHELRSGNMAPMLRASLLAPDVAPRANALVDKLLALPEAKTYYGL